MADSPRTRADARPPRGVSSRRRGAGGRRSRPRGKRGIVRKILLALVVLLALAVAAVVVAYMVIDVPEPNDRAVAQASVVYYSDGETEMDRIAEETGASLPAIALAWLVRQPGIPAPIASARTVEQLETMLEFTRLNLTEDQFERLTATVS